MIDPTTPSHHEITTSQIPAIALLMHLGYDYLLPSETVQLRGGRKSEVILFDILRQFLKKHNQIAYRGQTYEFEDKNIDEAIRVLRDIEDTGLVSTNQKIWDLLRLPKSLEQTIAGDTKSHDLYYIDWEHPENNFYHVTDEFEVERTGTTDTNRPDLVLFVNGIPFVVIECKRSSIDDPIRQGINQLRKYQQENYIPRLFHYAQLLLSIAVNAAQYGATGTERKFWSIWREEESPLAPLLKGGTGEQQQKVPAHETVNHPSASLPLAEQGTRQEQKVPLSKGDLGGLINTPLPPAATDKLFTPDHKRFDHLPPAEVRRIYQTNLDNGRTVTAQDKLLYALCRPQRLLELTNRFSLFDAGVRKVARYQQYFTVKRILQRLQTYQDNKRTGGVVWHTQGSGKSITMVFLAEAIADQANNPDNDIQDPRIVLVTDRTDLDDQIEETFANCGVIVTQATTGNHLRELLDSPKSQAITTVINKFDSLLNSRDYSNDSPNIFVLVDESHRTQFGSFHSAMRRVLPRACLIGFTGTPLFKQGKETVKQFGGMIQPTYTIRQAIEDNAVVRLLYEGRSIGQTLNAEAVDRWFERYTDDLKDSQKAQLQQHFTTKEKLMETDEMIRTIAWDVSKHFEKTWQGTGLKGQLVTHRKAVALKYKKYLDEFGKVSSEVLISPPGISEGEDDPTDDEEQLRQFWEKMMDHHSNPKQYQDHLINAFKYNDDPEILIVVSKLLTGFDAPRNTVLYLTRSLKDHNLLQAIARVNRIHEGKDFGYIIDYYGVLKLLNNALDLYGSMEQEYEQGDLDDTITLLSDEWKQLPQRHSDLWAVFTGVSNRQDPNALEEQLADDQTRQELNEALSLYARTLKIALTSVDFFDATPKPTITRYKQDLKFFLNLRKSAAQRYTDTLDFKQYQASIQKLLDSHVGAEDVQTIVEPVDIFDSEAFQRELDNLTNPVAKAETIATRTLRSIIERLEEDEAFYQPFSELLQDLIRQIRTERLTDADTLLARAEEIRDRVRNRSQRSDIPEVLRDKDIAQAYYGIVKNNLNGIADLPLYLPNLSAEIALAIEEIIQTRRRINWQQNQDVQNQMKTAIEDLIFEKQNEYGFKLDFDAIDIILDKCVDTAKVRLKDA